LPAVCCADAFHRPPLDPEPAAFPGLPADMRESRKIEGRLPAALGRKCLGRNGEPSAGPRVWIDRAIARKHKQKGVFMTFHKRALTILCAAAALSGATALEASTINSQRFQLNFAFHVGHDKKVFPAGEYQVERNAGEPFVMLRNTKTGASVNMMSKDNTHQNGKMKLIFKDDAEGKSLDKIQ
jgi:hypothetical protein